MSSTRSSIAPRRSARAVKAKLTARDRDALAQIRRMLKLEPGTFKFSVLLPSADDALPKTEAEVDAFIERRTRLWRQSWILPVLDEMIERGQEDDR